MLAFTEMRRARLRFGLLIGATGLLAFLILFQQALLGDLVTQFVGAIRNQSADVLVYSDQARQNVEGSVVPPATVDAARDVEGVADAGPLGEGTFTVTLPGAAELDDAVIFGYRLDGPGAPTTLVDGRLPQRDGEAVGSDDDFEIGDRVTVEPDGGTITVVGVASDVNYSVAPTLFTSFATFEDAARTRNPDAADVYPSLVAVSTDDGADASDVARALSAELDGVEGLTRAEAEDQSPGVAAVRSSFSVILLLAYLVVALVTGFFFLILTVQKASSLTLLRALGAPARLLVRSLLVQVVVVLVGGIAVATALLALTAATGRDTIGIDVEARPVLLTGAVLLVLGVLAALGAIRRVLRLDPMDAATGTTLGGLR